MKKEAVSIIGGADGPTSIFIAGKGKSPGKRSLKEHIRQRIYKYRRKRAEKKICAAPHTLKEVIVYAKKKYHAVEVPKTGREYMEQYTSAREGLIIMQKPELLGSLAEIAQPDVLNEETAKEIFRQIQLRSEALARIPDGEMPMDFHIYEIRLKDGWMGIQIDFKWDMFEVSYSGSKKAMKNMRRIAKELYMYYGVSGEDIQNKTKRYLSLLAVLSQ